MFKFIGTYNETSKEWTNIIPEIKDDDFIFDINDAGVCYVITDRDFTYDEKTGCLYLIEEVK